MRVNFAETELKDFEPVPAGWYLATIEDAEIRETKQGKNQGNEYVWVQYSIDEPSEYKGKKVWRNLSLLPHALFSLLEVAVGCELAEVGQDDFEFEVEDFIGKQNCIKVTVKKATEDYDASNDVKKSLPPAEYYDKVGAEAGALMP